MIPPFLNSLAATVRDLVRTGKAVHVSQSTAQELDLLAGLPWEHAGDGGIPCALKTAKIEERCHWCRTRNRITPADIALGWLLASRVHDAEWAAGTQADGLAYVTADALKRAAECAELAVIAAEMLPRVRNAGSNMTPFGPLPMIEPVPQEPHQGTPDGARAAWSFVCTSLQLDNPVRDRYRRELEAM